MDWRCSCPYEHGDICKHVAAVWLGLQRGDFERLVQERTSESLTLQKLLNTSRKRGLIDGLLALAAADEAFAELLLNHFQPEQDADAEDWVEGLEKQLVRFDNENADSFGFYYAGELASVFQPYCTQLDVFKEEQVNVAAWVLAKAVPEQAYERLDYVDHSNG